MSTVGHTEPAKISAVVVQLIVVAIAVSGCGASASAPAAESERALAANCGSTSYLEYKPKEWSNGCTAGSSHVRSIKWRSWTSSKARGVGALTVRSPDGSSRTPVTVVMDTVKSCRDAAGTVQEYFAAVRYRAENPNQNLGRRDFRIQPGSCQLVGD